MAIIRGTAVRNILRGTAVADSIFGLGGNDDLTGLAGNDTIDGGIGADTMRGGLGNDTYFVDNAGDLTIELAGQGTDTVRSSVTRTLSVNVENLVLTGVANLIGTGNTLNNVMTGNAGANTLNGGIGNDTLDGGAGIDRLLGGAGNDTYSLGATNDVVSDLSGIDTITSTVTRSLASYAGIENLTLLGVGNINGTGNGLNNTIKGNAGNNNIVGGTGGDVLIGGAGADVFVYNFVSDSPWDTTGATFQNFNVAINDTISGFQQGLDKIDLSLANHGIFDAGQPFYFSGNLLAKGGFWQPNQLVQSFMLAEVAFANFGADTYVYVNELHFQPNNQGGLWSNQDQTPDLLIKLTGVFTLTANDFIL